MKYFWLVLLCINFYTAQSQDFDWTPDMDPDGEGLDDFDWTDWEKKDWEDQVKDDYKEHYKNPDKRQDAQEQAYQAAQQEGYQPPVRLGPFTYDLETGELVEESDGEFAQRLDAWADELIDEAEGLAQDAALAAVYQMVEPLLLALKEKNVAILDAVLPRLGGVPAWDPVNEEVKEKQQTKKNWKYWIKMAAENIMQNLFKKNAEGKYELQREKVELLKQVGVVRFLKMSVMDWEVAQVLQLEVPEEILDYAQALGEVYHSADATLNAGKNLYREITTLDTDLNIPGKWNDLRQLSVDVATNKLTVAEMVNRRRKVLAGIYRQLSEQYQDDAKDLSRQIKNDQQLKMSDAERLKAQRIVQEYMNESLRLKEKSDRLTTASFQSPSTQLKDKLHANYSFYQYLDELYK